MTPRWKIVLDYVATYWQGIAAILIPILLLPIPLSTPGTWGKNCILANYFLWNAFIDGGGFGFERVGSNV